MLWLASLAVLLYAAAMASAVYILIDRFKRENRP